MAVTIHVASIRESGGDKYVVQDSAVPNTSGAPALRAYVEAEAADNFIVNVLTEFLVVTVNAVELNAAS